MRTRTRRRLVVPALLALLFGALLVGPAQATVSGPAAVPVEEEDQAFDEPGDGATNCLGGQQKRSLARLNDLPENLAEQAAFTVLPNSQVNFVTNDTDQIMVTFSAEAQLQGQPNVIVAPVDFLQVRLVLDGVPMPPHNDLMFNTDGGGAHAIEACQRVAEGQHALWVEWLLVDQAAANVLTATLDDSTLHIEIND